MSKPKKNDSSKKPPRKKKGEAAGPAKGHEPPRKKKGEAAGPAKGHEPPPAAPPPVPVFMDDEALIPGAAINGVHLARCIRYAAKTTPKEDGEIYFTHDEQGRALVSGHNLKASHTGFLVDAAAMLCDIAVPRDEAVEFAKMVEGLHTPIVRIGRDGVAIVRHGTAQPAIRFALGDRAITQTWQPPSQAGREAAVGSLRISASSQAAAVRWPEAIVHAYQSRDGIEWLNISDAGTGTLLARAVLAEDGKDLYAEDERQTEIPGSRRVLRPVTLGPVEEFGRTVVKPLAQVAAESRDLLERAIDDILGPKEDGGSVSITVDGKTTTIGGDVKLEPAVPPVETASVTDALREHFNSDPFPLIPNERTVIEVPEALWNELSSDALETLHLPSGLKERLSWFTMPDHTTSKVLDRETAGKVVAEFAKVGLCVATVAHGRRYGIDEVNVWTVGKAAG